MPTYEWYDYDVWGNAKDGFEVNDVLWTEMEVSIPTDATDAQIVSALRKAGIFKKSVRTKSVQIDGEQGYTLYFMSARGRPEGELRFRGKRENPKKRKSMRGRDEIDRRYLRARRKPAGYYDSADFGKVVRHAKKSARKRKTSVGTRRKRSSK